MFRENFSKSRGIRNKVNVLLKNFRNVRKTGVEVQYKWIFLIYGFELRFE